uniref:Secreted protein n=1 Tax=Steinernema glaseri TaxID=37863 RepID=A0A1I8AER5_9BILA
MCTVIVRIAYMCIQVDLKVFNRYLGTCNLGAPVTSSINVFVGLAGANYGMCNCEDAAAFMSPTCNRQNGFWPGDACGINVADCGSAILAPCVKPPYASFLTDLN